MRHPRLVLSTLIAAITLLSACSGSAADPGTLVALLHPASGELRFMQLGSGRVTERLALGGTPGAMLRDPARARLYVADSGGDSVAVVDVAARSVLLRIPVGRGPHSMALAPDGKRLFVTVGGEGVLAVVDMELLSVTARIPAGAKPAGLAVSPDGSRVFVANDSDGAILAVDVERGRPAFRPITTPAGVSGELALSSDGATVLAAGATQPVIVALTIANRQIQQLPLTSAGAESGPPSLVFPTPDGRFWLAGGHDGTLRRLPSGGGDTTVIALDLTPTSIAVAPGGRLLITGGDADFIAELDPASGKVTRRIRAGAGYTAVAIFPRASLPAKGS